MTETQLSLDVKVEASIRVMIGEPKADVARSCGTDAATLRSWMRSAAVKRAAHKKMERETASLIAAWSDNQRRLAQISLATSLAGRPIKTEPGTESGVADSSDAPSGGTTKSRPRHASRPFRGASVASNGPPAAKHRVTKKPRNCENRYRRGKRQVHLVADEEKAEAVQRVLAGEPRRKVARSVGRDGGTAESTLRGWVRRSAVFRATLGKIEEEAAAGMTSPGFSAPVPCQDVASPADNRCSNTDTASESGFESGEHESMPQRSGNQLRRARPIISGVSRATKRKRIQSDSSDEDGSAAKRRVADKSSSSDDTISILADRRSEADSGSGFDSTSEMPRAHKRSIHLVSYDEKVEAVRRVLKGEPKKKVARSVGREGGTAESTLRGWTNSPKIRKEAEERNQLEIAAAQI